MSAHQGPAATSTWTTRRYALSPAEWATSAVAAVASTTAYLVSGHPYLARGVVGDLLGLALLAVAGTAVGARVRHEAAVCLVLIGAVLLAGPQWPLALPEAAWWALFSVGLLGYLAVRKRLCD